MTCKYCGCSDSGACAIPVRVSEDGAAQIEFGPIEQLDPDIEYIPCTWLIPEVCTAPACVEKAYLALRIVDGVGLGWAA